MSLGTAISLENWDSSNGAWQVLGPGDTMPIHDPEEVAREERKKAREGPDPTAEPEVGTIPWARNQSLQYIAVSVIKAEDLLATSNLILTSRVKHTSPHPRPTFSYPILTPTSRLRFPATPGICKAHICGEFEEVSCGDCEQCGVQ